MRSDADLVDAVLAGETDAYAEFVRRYERTVRAEVFATLRHHHNSEEVVQDAFITAYQKLAELNTPSRFGPWLLQIARRRAIDVARRSRPLQSLENATEPVSPADNGQLEDDSTRLLAALARLPEHERIVITLRYFEDRKVREIAKITQRPVSTITVQLMRARARLRQWLKECEP